jgi:hypothetical protein
VQQQPPQAEVPADADGAGAVLRPALVVDVRDVAQLQPGAAVEGGQRDLDPGDVAADLPGHREGARWVAGLDDAVGVALELVEAADPEVTGDRQEPPGNALGRRHRVPDVGRGGRVGAPHGQDAGRAAVALAGLHRPVGGTDLVQGSSGHGPHYAGLRLY